jgi:hypothetical protein
MGRIHHQLAPICFLLKIPNSHTVHRWHWPVLRKHVAGMIPIALDSPRYDLFMTLSSRFPGFAQVISPFDTNFF